MKDHSTSKKSSSSQGKRLPKIGVILFLFASANLFLIPAPNLSAYYVQYKEQYYKLYHQHYIQYPDDAMENIYWLEKAIKADFANPLYALALIENEKQWEKYRYLFMMHINLKIIEQYRLLGSKWDKKNAYFYNAPWKEQNLESIKIAETSYQAGLTYWSDAHKWAEKALETRFRFIHLERVQFWEDEAARIADGSLNYARIVGRDLDHLANVRSRFEAMDDRTY